MKERVRRRVLVARLDNLGDVLLSGPAVRAVAASAEVLYLCGPAGRPAAELLPEVHTVVCFDAPWVGYEPAATNRHHIAQLLERLTASRLDAALVLTSFHQSPLPLALLLRLAGVEHIAGISVDYPGSLLDHRHPYEPELHEVEQALSLAGAAGFELPPGDDARLRLRPLPGSPAAPFDAPYVVVHPGASVPARAIPPALARSAVAALAEAGFRVVVTGAAREAALVQQVVGRPSPQVRVAVGLDFPRLAAMLAAASAVVAGNTGPAHLAAAVSVPVVSIFAPTVPVHRWRPWGVPSVVLGVQDVDCAGCRSRTCPLPDQVCVSGISAAEVVEAVDAVGAGVGPRAVLAPT